jgi:energy-coupling factor transporter transmembrane protein EcfT
MATVNSDQTVVMDNKLKALIIVILALLLGLFVPKVYLDIIQYIVGFALILGYFFSKKLLKDRLISIILICIYLITLYFDSPIRYIALILILFTNNP